jgi:hypothetical protein
VTGQLVDTLTGNHIWAERYDRVLEDIFAVQEEVTQAIVAAIAPQIASTEQSKANRRRPDNISAYEIALGPCVEGSDWADERSSIIDPGGERGAGDRPGSAGTACIRAGSRNRSAFRWWLIERTPFRKQCLRPHGRSTWTAPMRLPTHCEGSLLFWAAS